MVQGGDINNNNGSGGESIYGGIFEDEDLSMKHDNPGLVGMMNSGPNTNQSQFYITTEPCCQLDGRNVVVGQVVKGLSLVKEMSEYPRQNDIPLELLVIEDCGELKPGEPWNISENDGTEDIYPPWPDDCENRFLENSTAAEQTIAAIKNSGKHFFNKNDYINSERKYKKCLRYMDWSVLKKIEIGNIKESRNILVMNLSAVKLRLHKYKEVVELCNEVLKMDDVQVKALYRRAQARLALMDYDKALDDITSASRLLPQDKNILKVLKETKKHKSMYLKKERKFYSKIFR
ncbi:hypothetical protein JTB14_032147 [Gonioctena quinquepunctata]|nr:hypothetical protein JTB14_032147 [Gonioctena quinquepunctata]